MTELFVYSAHSDDSDTYVRLKVDSADRPFGIVTTEPVADENGRQWTSCLVSDLHAALFPREATPAGFLVLANDGFYAEFPWNMATRCSLRVLATPNHISRLVVSGPADPCLNVKSVAQVRFMNEYACAQAQYGKR